jgi:hypothetical protein
LIGRWALFLLSLLACASLFVIEEDLGVLALQSTADALDHRMLGELIIAGVRSSMPQDFFQQGKTFFMDVAEDVDREGKETRVQSSGHWVVLAVFVSGSLVVCCVKVALMRRRERIGDDDVDENELAIEGRCDVGAQLAASERTLFCSRLAARQFDEFDEQ